MTTATHHASGLAYDAEGDGGPGGLPAWPHLRPPHLAADRGASARVGAQHCDRPAGARRERRGTGHARRGRRSGARAARRVGRRAAGRSRALDDGRPRLHLRRERIRPAASSWSTADPRFGRSRSSPTDSSRRFAVPASPRCGRPYENSLGLERIPEHVRPLVIAAHDVQQEVVLGYWETLLRTDPAELQAWIDTQILPHLEVPCLAVFGRPTTDGERERFSRLPDVQLEEWTGDGHFVHLVDPDRFAASLRQFVDHCTGTYQGRS